jgi:hypothetical protein
MWTRQKSSEVAQQPSSAVQFIESHRQQNSVRDFPPSRVVREMMSAVVKCNGLAYKSSNARPTERFSDKERPTQVETFYGPEILGGAKRECRAAETRPKKVALVGRGRLLQ